jgi:hypothetical protein
MITILGLQEVDNMTREKIENELKELKEAHAADEGMFFFYVLIGFITLYMLHFPFLFCFYLYFLSCLLHFIGYLPWIPFYLVSTFWFLPFALFDFLP